ncbi:MAG: hypothetical protein ACLSUM_00790 [Dysosmobacter welbionis]
MDTTKLVWPPLHYHHTLSDDDVLTIKHVLQGNTSRAMTDRLSVNTSSTAGVADNGTVIRMNTSVDQVQYTAPNGYTGGRGSITGEGWR